MIHSNNYNYLLYIIRWFLYYLLHRSYCYNNFIIRTYLISCSPQFAQCMFMSRRLSACSSCVQFLMGMFILTASPHIVQKRTRTFVRLWLVLRQWLSCLLIVSSPHMFFVNYFVPQDKLSWAKYMPHNYNRTQRNHLLFPVIGKKDMPIPPVSLKKVLYL